VDHLNLEVSPGEAFALVGPDAAGKTTTMRLLVGLMDPDEGRAEIQGFDTVTQGDQVRGQIGYMPQRFGLYDDLTVSENIAFYADLYRVDRETRAHRVPELLEFSGLAPFTDRLAANLSGGMRQKLGLVCALIHRPQVLFLDEPTLGLDPDGSRRIIDLIKTLNQERQMTVLLSSHHLQQVQKISHRVGIMIHGKMVAEGTIDDLAKEKFGVGEEKYSLEEIYMKYFQEG